MRLVAMLASLLVAVTLAVQNSGSVPFQIFFWGFDASLAVILAICFALGVGVAALAMAPGIYRRRNRELKLRAKVVELQASPRITSSSDQAGEYRTSQMDDQQSAPDKARWNAAVRRAARKGASDSKYAAL